MHLGEFIWIKPIVVVDVAPCISQIIPEAVRQVIRLAGVGKVGGQNRGTVDKSWIAEAQAALPTWETRNVELFIGAAGAN